MGKFEMFFQYLYSLGPGLGIYTIFVITQFLNTFITFKMTKRQLLKNMPMYAEPKTFAENNRLKEEIKILKAQLRKQETERQADRAIIRSACNILNGYRLIESKALEVK